MSAINSSSISFGASGNLIVGSGSGATAPLALGTQYQILTANSGQTLGVEWSSASSAGSTWLPTVVGQTTAGTATYTLQQGFFVQIGVLMFVSAAISFNTFTGTGALSVQLPFVVTAGLETTSNGICIFDGAYTSGTNIEATAIGGTMFTVFSVFGSGSVVSSQDCVPAADLSFYLMYQI